MTGRQLQALQRAIAANDWVRAQSDSEGSVFAELQRRGYLRRRRIENHHEYHINPAVIDAARSAGIIP